MPNRRGDVCAFTSVHLHTLIVIGMDTDAHAKGKPERAHTHADTHSNTLVILDTSLQLCSQMQFRVRAYVTLVCILSLAG